MFDSKKYINLSGGWFIYLSIFIALYLQTLPMPDFLLLFKPKWVALILAYWCLMQPYRIGLMHGFIIGLLIDLIEGTSLGQNAIYLTLVCYFIYKSYQKIRMFSIPKQTLSIFAILLFAQLIFALLQTIANNQEFSIIVFLPVFISTLIWPWLYIVMQYLKTGLKIN